MNRTWGYTKRPKNWKDRLEHFYKKLDELDKQDVENPPVVENQPVVEKPPVVENPPSRPRRSTPGSTLSSAKELSIDPRIMPSNANSNKLISGFDSSFSH
ncbi:hypothetical protein [Bartonella sp. CL42QHWL]|uniref:hypothetical protein n=1 Tax=Bartonella sp. CL42QHWL TaxID=3243528 RepID=UPI0035D0321F